MKQRAWFARWSRPALMIAAVLLVLAGAGKAFGAQKTEVPREGYILRQGDEVAITVLPRSEYDCSAAISPDGMLYLKRIGPVRAAGYTVAELTRQVETALGAILRKPRVTVTLVKLAQLPPTPQVTVVGAVTKPGPLPLAEGLRLRKALEFAGGTTPEADLRRVVVLRKDLSRMTLDLSQSEQVGDPTLNVLLEDGDSIEVPARARIKVTVVGAVTKPGPLDHVPEAGASLRVLKALELAGGTVKDADLSKITIYRPDLSRAVVDLSQEERVADPLHNQVLQDGDSVYVPLLFRSGVVSVSGAVTNPGSYELKPGASIDDAILAAGKLLLVADVERVELRRRSRQPQILSLPQLQEKGVNGRVVLEPGDEIHIPNLGNVVMLIGKVVAPGPRPLKGGDTLHEFFTLGQPETQSALDASVVDLGNVQVIRPGQEARKINLKAVLKNPRHRDNVVLKAGDVVFLPARVERQKRSIVDYLRVLPFFGSLAGLFP